VSRAVRVGLELGLIGGLVALGLALPDAGQNQLGHHVAPPGGDLSLGPAPRDDLVAEGTARCGPPGPVAPELRRLPYLQRTDAHGTAILWTAAPGPRADVEIWAAGGPRERRRLASVLDEVPAPDGAAQALVEVGGLEPGAAYCYEVVADGERWFGPIGFRTAPLDGRAVHAIALGDLGFRTIDQAAVLRQLLAAPAELALLTGDIAYPYGRAEELEDAVFSVYAPLMARLPFFPAAGNHDYLTDDGAPLRAAFALPENGGAEGRERWYSFDWGAMHVVVLDGERLTAAQLAWLDVDLAAVDRPFTVAVTHRPAFSSGVHGGDPAALVLLHPVFVRHRVSLVLSGHDHHYERSRPVDGVTYVVTGGGGRGTTPVTPRATAAFAARVAHHLVLEVDDRALRLWAVDAAGATFDTLELVSGAGRGS
jgi:hypothetical protein